MEESATSHEIYFTKILYLTLAARVCFHQYVSHVYGIYYFYYYYHHCLCCCYCVITVFFISFSVTVSAVKSGQITVWHSDEAKEINALKSGEFLSHMRQDPQSPNMIATGGKENDLQLWDLNKPEEPIFKAKNVCRSYSLSAGECHLCFIYPCHDVFVHFISFFSSSSSFLSFYFFLSLFS